MLAGMALTGILALAGCSDHDEPEPTPDPGREPTKQIQFADDLLKGGLVYVAEYSEADGFNIPIQTSCPLNFKICRETPFSVKMVDDEEGIHLIGQRSGTFSDNAHVMVMRAESKEDPSRFRHFLVVVINKDGLRKTVSMSNSANMTRAYGDLMGMGTQCFEMMGNTKRAILQSSLIPIEDQNLVTSQVLDLTEMFEISGESFQSAMTSWSANVGVSFKGLNIAGKPGDKMAGCINFGISKNVNTSEDFEYYMNVYKVVRGEIAYNMKEFESMASDKENKNNEKFLSFISAGFMRDILEVENPDINTEDFFTTWGTDMISQAQLGGFKIYMYGRETNTYENSIGFDASLELQATRPATTDGSKGWYDIYRAKNSPYIGGNVGAAYQNNEYFSASRMMKYSLAVGGNPSLGEDPDKWISGFESVDDNVKWQPISYRRHSDSSNSGSSDVWCLYPIEDMATNVINAVELQLRGETLSEADSLMLDNARNNVASIANAKMDYVERHLTHPKEPTRLVLCDVMMKWEPNYKQTSGKPEPFVAKDPRDDSKYRTYYPMMANKFFDKARSSEPQRGHAIDTNVGCFISGVPYGSHYWYYALAHEDDCQGIVDITFYDHLEDYFSYRGNAASEGSGLLNYAKRVCVKYYDPGAPADKITAFGIFDDHREVNNIIASTGGSELALEATESEYNRWVEFWKGAKDHHNWPKYAFYHGGGAIPHGIYVKYSTKTLPIENIKNVKHPQKY